MAIHRLLYLIMLQYFKVKNSILMEFHSNRGIFKKFIAPGHPATNGLAERNVQTLKQKLKVSFLEKSSIPSKVQNILFRYRATPLACGQSPAQLYLHRKIRIRLNSIFPYHPTPSTVSSTPVRSFSVGERVQVRLFINNHNVWQFGKVVKKYGTRHYLILLDSGRQLKRHINQLRSTLIPEKKKCVTFGPTQSFDIPRPSKISSPTQPSIPELPTNSKQDVVTKPKRKGQLPTRFRDFVMS
nr:uncharacterized protein LOC122268726 [Parasteatoda tepidariorum]